MQTPELVAELGASHNGSLDRALRLIDAAKAAGASACKFQCWSPDSMCLDRTYALTTGPWAGRKLAELYREAWTDWSWYGDLVAHCRKVGIPWFASVFDHEALAFLEQLGCPRYKVSSFELVDLDLIAACAATGRPLILSTGMATLAEIQQAVHRARRGTAGDLTLLRCVSGYPSAAAEANLAAMAFLADRFQCKAGLSDHTLGNAVPIAAAALGASMIEKHLTLSRDDGGLDAGFSLEPIEFANMVNSVRMAQEAVGDGIWPPLSPSEVSQLPLRRSLYVCRDVREGEPLSAEAVRTARPGKGLAPYWMASLQSMQFRHAVPAGTPLTMDLLISAELAKTLRS